MQLRPQWASELQLRNLSDVARGECRRRRRQRLRCARHRPGRRNLVPNDIDGISNGRTVARVESVNDGEPRDGPSADLVIDGAFLRFFGADEDGQLVAELTGCRWVR